MSHKIDVLISALNKVHSAEQDLKALGKPDKNSHDPADLALMDALNFIDETKMAISTVLYVLDEREAEKEKQNE